MTRCTFACLLALATPSTALVAAPARALAPRRIAAPLKAIDVPKNELQKEVETRRLLRKVGLGLGGGLLSGGVGLGVVAGVLPKDLTLAALYVTSFASAFLFGAYTLSFDAHDLPNAPVAVGESAPGMGQGLFATAEIPSGTYLFDYEGECLSETEMFARYPDAKGRYIACIGEAAYIDGADEEKSGLARWINHSQRRANVRWRKQRFGPVSPAMHFYALRDIAEGEELFFDYGDEYWAAMGVEPID